MLALPLLLAAPLLLATSVAIMPGTAVPEMLHQCSRPVPVAGAGRWRPDAAAIARLEAALPAALGADPLGRTLPVARGLSSAWGRQYVGFIRGGRRYLYGNFFPVDMIGEYRENGVDWRKRPVVVCDGGPSMFGVEMDAATGHITHLAFNGRV